MDSRGIVRAGTALLRSGLLTPRRPDRVLAAGVALRRYGPTLAAAVEGAAALDPDATAIVDERGRLTRRELAQRSRAIATGLIDAGALAPGRRVAVLVRDSAVFVEALAAAAYGGATAVLMNTGFSTEQALDVAAREGCTALIADAEYSEILDRFPGAGFVAWPDDTARSSHPTLDDLAERHRNVTPSAPSRQGTVVILTSGTTGPPKGAKRDTTAPQTPTAGLAMLSVVPYRSGETWSVAAPLFHSLGFAHVSMAMALSCTIVVRRRFDAAATLATISAHRARVLVAVPVMLQRLIELSAVVRDRYDTSSLRLVPLSGSAIPAGLAESFMDAFGDCVYNLYGSTEVGYISVASPVDLRTAPGTAGRVLDGVSVRLLDEHDRTVPKGSTGRIFVKSPLLFSGYTDGESKLVVDGHMSTGDTGHIDAGGRLFVEGRDDDMVVCGGENVFPREVEDVIATYPGVLEAAVVGVDDPKFGKRLVADVVRRPGAKIDADDVRGHVRGRLARYKVPRDVHFVDELPRNPTGKILRRRLNDG